MRYFRGSPFLLLPMAEFLSGFTGPAPETITRVLLTLGAGFGVWLVRRLLLEVVERHLQDTRAVYQWSKASAYTGTALVLLILGQIWLPGIGSVGTFLGLLSAGLAIALRDLVASLAGWIFILLRRPFEVGDRIQVGDHAGDVVDIRIFQFSILEIGNWVAADQSTGRLIHVPNLAVFTTPLANYTSHFPYLWNELAVTVTFESDWRKARRLLEEAALRVSAGVAREAEETLQRTSRKLLIHYRNLSPIVYTAVTERGVLLTLRYLCAPRTRRGTAQEIWEAFLDGLAAGEGVTLAYPTHRVVGLPLQDPHPGPLVQPPSEA